MCGIAGLLGIERNLTNVAAPKMLHALRHRGPDGYGVEHLDGQNPFGPVMIHTRLAIVDLTAAGHQPMRDHPTDPNTLPNWIVFNGEIFNYLDLQRELAEHGWPCRTRCDTEVILHAYRVWGEKAVERFHGMFAFCLIDQAKKQAWFCRDRLGIQPLYLARSEQGGLMFASEVRALLATGPSMLRPMIRPSALEAFLAQGAVYGDQSIVQGVELLQPGHFLITDLHGQELRRERYWQLPPPAACPFASREEAVAEIGREIRTAVRQRLIADVPLGLFLSGGIDSGALATIITEDPEIRLKSISIGFDNIDFDETDIASEVARTLGTDHRVMKLRGEEVLKDLPRAIDSFDQPTIDGFNTYFVSREAHRAGLTVALSGTGGDELFGGYPTFQFVPKTARAQSFLQRSGPLKPLAYWLMQNSGRRGAQRLAELCSRPYEAIQRYLLRWELFLGPERRQLHSLPEGSDPSSGIPLPLLDEMRNPDETDPITQVSRFEVRGFLGQILLRDGDISCLSNQLELRTPLLEHRVVELAIRARGDWKKPDPRNKPLLIDAVGPRFPSFLLERPKRGFSLPWKSWLTGPLAQQADDMLQTPDVWKRIGFNPKIPMKLWARFISGDRCVAPTQILALMVLARYVQRHGLNC